jgi:hypothetical protein
LELEADVVDQVDPEQVAGLARFARKPNVLG